MRRTVTTSQNEREEMQEALNTYNRMRELSGMTALGSTRTGHLLRLASRPARARRHIGQRSYNERTIG